MSNLTELSESLQQTFEAFNEWSERLDKFTEDLQAINIQLAYLRGKLEALADILGGQS